jgi:transposase
MLRSWIRRYERDAGQRPGLTTTDLDPLKQLECEDKDLRRTNKILKKASAYSAQADVNRRGS